MIIIETCPKCGHDLESLLVCTNPPIPRKECHNCGWSWEGHREVLRIPFQENDMSITKIFNYGDTCTPVACAGCSNHPKNGGSGICHCTLGQPQLIC